MMHVHKRRSKWADKSIQDFFFKGGCHNFKGSACLSMRQIFRQSVEVQV